ncbi:MAG: response regulator [Thermodesulfovibrionales bacterium]|nr:response regulator [Thermodesulfovibrionales bacterium]
MKKILIVDEIKSAVEEEQGILKRADIHIFTAGTGDEALNVHRAEKVNLIIAALDMPGMNGDELCCAIREDGGLKKVSVILVCNRRKADIERCANCGANSYITQPINPEELRQKVGKLLDVPGRRDLRVLIKAEVKGYFKSKPFYCTSENISRSGLLLEAGRALAKGDKVSCSFFIPDEYRIIADCEVVRVAKKEMNTYYYGIRFTNIDEGYVAAIDRYVEKRLRGEA